MSDAVLRFENVTRRRGSRAVVDDMSFTIGTCETLCLLGPSGCGKTTCLRLAAGIDRPDSGRIYIDGVCVSDSRFQTPPESRGIGFLFQDYALFPHLTIAANIGFGVRSGISRKSIVDEMLERVDLVGRADDYPQMLSGGEQQRAALARTLAARPKIVLMDEPFASLDPQLRDEMRDFVKSLLSEAETSALIVTHDPNDAMRIATRIAVQSEGRLLQLAAPEDVYQHPSARAVAEVFGALNTWRGEVRNNTLTAPFGQIAYDCPDGVYHAVVRPSDIYCSDGAVSFDADVQDVRRIGADWLVDLRLLDGTLWSARVRAPLMPLLGVCKFSIADRAIMLFDTEDNFRR